MPQNPNPIPYNRAGVARSPPGQNWEIKTTATGVMAFAIPATDTVTCCCASGRNAKGAANWKTPKTATPTRLAEPRSTRRRVAITQTQHPIAPVPTRSAETVNGP